MKINTNVPALYTYLHMTRNNKSQSASMQRLSSALRINSVSDDAAGMAIANKMSLLSEGLQKASKNALDGISLVQTADGSLNEIHNMLQRMRELSVQSANDSNEINDRLKMKMEFDQLVSEINQTSDRTEFNRIKLLNGSAGFLSIPDDVTMGKVINASETVEPGTYSFDVISMGAHATFDSSMSDMFSSRLVLSNNPLGLKGSISINETTVEISEEDNPAAIFEKLRMACEANDLVISKDTAWGNGTAGGVLSIQSKYAGSTEKISIASDNNALLYGIGLADTSRIAQTTLTGRDAVVDNVSFASGTGIVDPDFADKVTVSVEGNRVRIRGENSKEIVVDLKNNLNKDNTNEFKFVVNDGGLVLQIGPNKTMEMKLVIPNLNAEGLEIDRANISTQSGSGEAIKIMDSAIAAISRIRSRIGAYQNRLEYTVTSLDATADFTQQSLSRIRDTDMAKESAEMAKYSVMVQAAISVMAQANMRPQQMLRLLD